MALTDNLISYWKLDEATAASRADSVGTNTLTDVNSVSQQTGKISNCAGFASASSQKLTLSDNSSISTGDIDFTFSGWVYFTTLGAVRDLWTKWVDAGNQREYLLLYNSGTNRLEWYVSNNGTAAVVVTANNFGAPSTSTWYHVVTWHDSVNNQIGIAVNAGTADTASHTTGVFDSTATFALGARNTSPAYHNGRIDELGFWKRVLTSTERTQLYNSGNGLAYPFAAGVPLFMHHRKQMT